MVPSGNCDGFADAWASAPLLVTAFGQVEVYVEDIGHACPVSLNLA
jgi:hypothetical protein